MAEKGEIEEDEIEEDICHLQNIVNWIKEMKQMRDQTNSRFNFSTGNFAQGKNSTPQISTNSRFNMPSTSFFQGNKPTPQIPSNSRFNMPSDYFFQGSRFPSNSHIGIPSFSFEQTPQQKRKREFSNEENFEPFPSNVYNVPSFSFEQTSQFQQKRK